MTPSPNQSQPASEQKQSLLGDPVTNEAWRAHGLGESQRGSTQGSPPRAPAAGIGKWGSPVGDSGEAPQILRRLNTDIADGPAISLLGLYLKELKAETQTDTSMPRLTAASFTATQRWK